MFSKAYAADRGPRLRTVSPATRAEIEKARSLRLRDRAEIRAEAAKKLPSPRAQSLLSSLAMKQSQQKLQDSVFKNRPLLKKLGAQASKNFLKSAPTTKKESPQRLAKKAAALQAAQGGVAALANFLDSFWVSFPIFFDEFDYDNWMDDETIDYIYEPTADYISIDFDYVDMESPWDYISIVDSREVECARITGYYPTGLVTIRCPGNYLEIRVTTDGSVTKTGFDVAGYTYYENVPNLDPVAIASANDTTVSLGETVRFTGSSSYDPDTEYGDYIEEYFWDFDDGFTSSLANPTHYFDQAGTYYVTLTVYDTVGGESTWGFNVYVADIADPVMRPEIIGSNFADFSWTAGDSETDGYYIGIFTGNRTDLSCDDGTDVGLINSVHYNLNPGTNYTFLICAYNRFDWFSLGWVIPFRTLDAVTPVSNLRATTITTNSISFEWSPGSVSTVAYKVGFAAGDQPTLACTGAEQSNSVDFRNSLQPGSVYTIAVCGVTAQHVVSAPVRRVVTTNVNPPTTPEMTLRTETQLAFRWNSGSANTTKYYVAFASGNGANLTCDSASDYGSATTLTSGNNLIPGAQYSLLVCSANSAGVRFPAPVVSAYTIARQSPFRINIRRLPDRSWEVTFPATARMNYTLQYSGRAEGPYLDSDITLTVTNGSGRFHFLGGLNEDIMFFRVKATPQ